MLDHKTTRQEECCKTGLLAETSNLSNSGELEGDKPKGLSRPQSEFTDSQATWSNHFLKKEKKAELESVGAICQRVVL